MGKLKEPRELAVRGNGTALVDAEASRRLQVAASSAGLTLEQLVDLVADSGLLALPPGGDGITSRLTLGDLGQRMHAELLRVPQLERPAWFQKLAPVQQRAMVVAARGAGYSSEAIAKELEVSTLSVQQAYNHYADEIGSNVTMMRLNTIAGQVTLQAERAQQGLAEDGDWKSYWQTAKDMVKVLQSLGIVDQAIHRVEVTHKFDGQKQQELGALLDLERKKRVREEEIKRVQVEVHEPLAEKTP